jgi:hypothetical protein
MYTTAVDFISPKNLISNGSAEKGFPGPGKQKEAILEKKKKNME